VEGVQADTLAEADFLAEVDLGLVQQDLVLAFKWFTLAATQRNETAEMNMGVIDRWMTPEEVAEAQRLSQEWMDAYSRYAAKPSETIRIQNR